MTITSGPTSTRREKRARVRAVLLFVASFIASGALTAISIDALAPRSDATSINWRPAQVENDLENLARLRAPATTGRVRRVVIHGDSTVAAYDDGLDLASLTEIALERPARKHESIRVAQQAFVARGISTSVLMADLVLEAEPDLVVWQVSLAHFARRWRRDFAIPEAAGWVSLSRLPELLTYPIHEVGLTAGHVMLYQAIVRSGAYSIWRDVRLAQMRVGRARNSVERWLNVNDGDRPEFRVLKYRHIAAGAEVRHESKLRRYSADGERRHFDEALDGLEANHVMVRLLEFGVRSYTDRGVEVLVYLNPINVEHLANEGILDVALLAKSIDTIETAVLDAGGHMLDLHDLFPDTDFHDAAGHYRTDRNHQIPRRLARRLADDIRLTLDAERMPETE